LEIPEEFKKYIPRFYTFLYLIIRTRGTADRILAEKEKEREKEEKERKEEEEEEENEVEKLKEEKPKQKKRKKRSGRCVYLIESLSQCAQP
jgi:sortase (surface protein transpeptidase)